MVKTTRDFEKKRTVRDVEIFIWWVWFNRLSLLSKMDISKKPTAPFLFAVIVAPVDPRTLAVEKQVCGSVIRIFMKFLEFCFHVANNFHVRVHTA